MMKSFAFCRYLSLAVLLLQLLVIPSNHVVDGFSTPTFGLGAALFRPSKTLTTNPATGDTNALLKASDFFVDAFWVGKVGGGTTTLNDRQRRSLSASQFMEFRSRYGKGARGQADLIVCKVPETGEVVGCAGLEVSPIPKGSLKGEPGNRSPLMSNVAVSRNYRRKGIGELLVKEVERIARYEWGYDDCYLYVEERNAPAVRLYQKLGYKRVWVDKDAKTLLPTANGNLQNAPTKIVCMRKRLDLGVMGRLWPF